ELEELLVGGLSVGGHGTAELVGIESVHRRGRETHLGENLSTRPCRHDVLLLLMMGGLEGPPKPPRSETAQPSWDAPRDRFSVWGPRKSPKPAHSTVLIRPEDQVGLEVGDFGATAETHRDVQLIAQNLEDARDALGAVGGEAPERGPAEQDDLGPARQALDHVGALREAAVDDDLGAAGDRVDDGWQRLDGRLRVIEL